MSRLRLLRSELGTIFVAIALVGIGATYIVNVPISTSELSGQITMLHLPPKNDSMMARSATVHLNDGSTVRVRIAPEAVGRFRVGNDVRVKRWNYLVTGYHHEILK